MRPPLRKENSNVALCKYILFLCRNIKRLLKRIEQKGGIK